jgi:hypothetical protein
MAWTAPRTWVTAELVTAALMNTHVRDNLKELYHLIGSFGGSDYSVSPELTWNLMLAVGPVTVAGNPVYVEVAARMVSWAAGDGGGKIGIWDSGNTTELKRLWQRDDTFGTTTGTSTGGFRNWYEVTPSAGSITWNIRGNPENGTGGDSLSAWGLRVRVWEKGGP